MTSDPRTTVAEWEADALAEFTGLLSGTALCRVPADRAVRVKRLEGRAAALADVRRALAGSPGAPDAPPVPLATVLADLGPRWAAGPRGPLWEAYRDGGRRVLAELAARG